MPDATRDLQHDIALLRRAIEIASEFSAGEAGAISGEIASLQTALAALTERLASLG
jgi:hypothetical protein